MGPEGGLALQLLDREEKRAQAEEVGGMQRGTGENSEWPGQVRRRVWLVRELSGLAQGR